LCDATGDDFRVHDESLGDVLERRENDVRGEERFGQRDSSICTCGGSARS
jgi:hypothetical protein